MVRKFALAVAALLLASISWQVQALGLGEIELKSGLNEPMEARINLRSADPDGLADMFVGLASSAAFAQSGIERPFFLTQLRFKILVDEAGQVYVRVSSKKSVREPFISFLVELNWANGRLLREYTVLLDPPVMVPAQARPTISAPTQIISGEEEAAESVLPTQPLSVPSSSAPVQQRTIVVADGEYGPTQRKQTLWGIAEQIRPDSDVSIEQTMLGLLRDNPRAFYGNNINRLKAGHVLRVPSKEDIQSLTQAQALRDVSAQYREWREFKAARSSAQPQIAGTGRTVDSGVTGGSRLKLVAPDVEGDAGFDKAAGQPGAEGESVTEEVLRRELSLAAEGAEANRLENEELRSRLDKLEEQLNSLQRILSLKDEQLATLQAQLGEDTPQLIQPEDAEQPAEITESAEAAQQDGEQAPMAMKDESPAGEMEQEQGEVEEEHEAAEEKVAEAEQPTTVAEAKPKPMPMQQDQHAGHDMEEKGFLDSLLESDLTLKLAAGGGVIFLLIVVMLITRMKRKAAESDEFDTSAIQADGDSDSDQVVSLVDTLVGEISLPDAEEQAPDLDEVGSDEEAGLLAEADVYIAYGRYPEAEKLIRSGIEEEPGRQDLRVKLLEILHAMRNTSDFDAQAEEFHAMVGSESDPDWTKVVALGKDLNPENSLYGDEELGDLPDDLDLEGTLNLGADAFAEMVDADMEDMEEPPLDLDFELTLGDEAGVSAVAADESEAPTEVSVGDETGIEFEMDLPDDSEVDLEFGSMFDDEETATIDTAGFGDGLTADSEEEPESDDSESEGADDDLAFDLGEFDASDGVDLAPSDDEQVDLDISASLEDLGADADDELDLSLATMKGEITESSEEGAEPFAIEWDVTGTGLGDEDEETGQYSEGDIPADLSDEGEETGQYTGMEIPADLDAESEVTETVQLAEKAEVELPEVDLPEIEDDDLVNDSTIMAEIAGDVEMCNTKLDLATAYIEMGDADGARGILDEVKEDGNDEQKTRAQELIDSLD